MPEPLLLGVRHHGPGSARAVRRALEAYRPQVLLIEGPPEADALVALAGSEDMRPPVALLAYAADLGPTSPAGRHTASYWPFAEFSPEWQAIRWAVAAGVTVRFCDLPAAQSFAARTPTEREPEAEPASAEPPPSDVDPVRVDPIAALASAGGYDDPERWWEDVVEHRLPTTDSGDELAAATAPFAAIAEAMAAVRSASPPPGEAERVREERREAFMRTTLRAAMKGYERVAVVCGAWHVPALTAPRPTATADAAVLKGLPKAKITMTWVPWTHGRLASWQGYGAGVSSPGWYHHLFTARDRPVTRWLVNVAGVLREEGLGVSGAHVIEAVRLAEALATLRGRPLAGLAEVTEATRSVLCDGDDLRLSLVNRRLVVGERLGEVPAETPSVPLVADVAAAQRRLRMAPSALDSGLELDLRKEFDLHRSRLLHRLGLLGIAWGSLVELRGQGTFKEGWRLRWQPEFAVDLVVASGYGTTVAAAATAKTAQAATEATALDQVTTLVELCLLADLPDAYPTVLRALDERVALDADVGHLMTALPALARTLRYGDVRGTDVSALRAVTRGLVVRICVGLPGAVADLDDDAADQMRRRLDSVHAALSLLDDPARLEEWLATLTRLVDRADLNGLLAGRVTRLLLDAGRMEAVEAGRRLSLTLTVGVPPARAAGFVEGFLAGGGLLLVHDQRLLSLVDSWLAGIPEESFVEVLPLLRRTFATFASPERRAIGERVRHLDRGTGAAADRADEGDEGVDPDRADLVLPTLRWLLGRDVLGVGHE